MCKREIILAGTGGQGIILMGIVLARAGLLDGKYVIQSQNYGPESRGGASRTDVILSEDVLYYPKVLKADIFLTLSQEAFNKYYDYITGETVVITDSSVNTGELGKYNKFGIAEFAYNKLNKPMAINMVSLGIINRLTSLVSPESIKKAIEISVPSGTAEMNYFAYLQGYNLPEN